MATGFLLSKFKWNDKARPYSVQNEVICATLGTAIGLPVPPFGLSKTATTWPLRFASLDFNPASLNHPPVLPDLCMANMPYLSTGVILFDIWIANEDRHDENLVVDKISNPKEMRVFDHCQALFGGFNEVGAARFEKLWDRLGITGSTITGGNEHCLLPYLTTDKDIDSWVDRIQSVQDWVIRDACNSMRKVCADKSDAEAAAQFLIHRRNVMKHTLVPLLCKERNIVRSGKSNQRGLFDKR